MDTRKGSSSLNMKTATQFPKTATEFPNRSRTILRQPSISNAASTLLNDSKKVATAIYNEGKHKVNEAQSNLKEYSDEMANQIRTKPLLSLLIAGGIGYLISAILRRH